MPSTEEKKLVSYHPKQCPICGALTYMIHHMQSGGERSDYWHCKCGVVFQEEFPLNENKTHEDVYTKDYANNYLAMGDKFIDIAKYPARVFAPLIEELTYGRKMLEVGYLSHFFMQAMKERGWLTWGIDVMQGSSENERLIKGNFETHDFKNLKFNLIWMSHVFEHFKDPVAVLKKCYDLMPEDGVLYIATPDTDFIHTRSNSGFSHWKKDEHYIMWNARSLERELDKVGFDVILSRRNHVERFSSWDDIQVIAQKKYF